MLPVAAPVVDALSVSLSLVSAIGTEAAVEATAGSGSAVIAPVNSSPSAICSPKSVDTAASLVPFPRKRNQILLLTLNILLASSMQLVVYCVLRDASDESMLVV